ncbi:MAG: diguanylate cyclase [Proteobacteria bacterium]|nr:diguanylate cyclase [Pseudomonadota bacterium]MBU1639259.1 diguanylate cyclase [Pseudomonadota bacterium]
MKLLIADDDRVSCLKLASLLEKWGYEVLACENGNEAWERVQEKDSPSILILDWMMPGLSGLDICRKVREQAREPYTYILLLTSRTDKDDIIQGMDAGADDYITKPFYPHELEVRLRAGQRIVGLNRELLAARNALKEQASRDALTGLLNRRAIMERLDQEMVRRTRQGKGLCVGIMDIDHFKKVNDTYGHNVGDEVLLGTAQRIQAALRPYDSIGRYGGEEFLIIMADTSCDETYKHFERLRRTLADLPLETGKGPIAITASFGVGMSGSDQSIEPEQLIGIADIALYKAKERGRNRVEVEEGGSRPAEQQPKKTC